MPTGTDSPSVGARLFSAGFAACTAEAATFPLDTAKVRLQLQGESVLNSTVQRVQYRGLVNTIHTICRREGVLALYGGLVPGFHRQMLLASIRIGLYEDVKQLYLRLFQAEGLVSNTNVGLCVLAGVTTGALGILCAQPTDIVKVRMQAQLRGAPQRYSGTANAYAQILKKDGLRGLWKGLLPNVVRNSLVNAAEMVTYDMMKEAILARRLLADDVACHVTAAFASGFFATVVSSPVDVMKTRYVNAESGVYRCAMHCARCMYREGGLAAFYKGFIPAFTRLGTWNITMFVCFEQCKRLFVAAKSQY